MFAGLDLAVNRGQRLALVGHNGCGKSTLLALLAGEREPDTGEVQRRRNLRVARVEQFLPQRLADRSVQGAVAECFEAGQDWRAESLLEAFGFAAGDLALPVSALSGGQQNRLMFARALASEPELLLLDEPTNHLDLATLVVFERVLETFRGAFVLVSHDRSFLDSVTRETLFLRDGRLYRFAAPYSSARQLLAEHDEAGARARAAEEKRIEGLRQSARRLAEWGRVYDNEAFARRAQSMQKRIARLETEKTFVTDGSPLDLALNLGESRSRQALSVRGHRVAVAGRLLFEIDELVLRPGERVALLGHNGVGKSTFIRQLVAATGEHETLRFSPQTELGYYDQELAEVRAQPGASGGEDSLLEFALQRAQRPRQTVIAQLVRAGFPHALHGKSLSALSGGERARLLFLVLALRRPNFLILDEPTNHIDIDGREQLEDQLLDSSATVLVTSHDRHFLDRVAQRYLWIHHGRLKELNDPTTFYRAPPGAATGRGEPVAPARAAGTAGTARPGAPEAAPEGADPTAAEADALLERIVELEALLEADRARKPKHQKPGLQIEWQRALDQATSALEALESRQREDGR
ncbi:MAG: ABC-F family ATP-binding cassette domain-containing protein [Pseudomonadales bacterium]